MSAGRPKAGSRLGTQLRGKLQQDYDRRGKSRYSLWYVYSPKGRRDFVLHGDLRYGSFLHIESDPSVKFVDYAPRERVARIVGDDLADCVDAELHLEDGSKVWRSVQPRQATQSTASSALGALGCFIERRTHKDLPARIESLTEGDIYEKPQRIQNWSRLIPWLAQAREWPLHEIGNEVAALLHARREIVLRDVLDMAGEANQGLYVAALLHGVQFGHFLSDLNDLPWSKRSRFYVREKA